MPLFVPNAPLASCSLGVPVKGIRMAWKLVLSRPHPKALRGFVYRTSQLSCCPASSASFLSRVLTGSSSTSVPVALPFLLSGALAPRSLPGLLPRLLWPPISHCSLPLNTPSSSSCLIFLLSTIIMYHILYFAYFVNCLPCH